MSQRRKGRGFAGMDVEKQRAIARLGGKAAHEKGTAHEFDSGEARIAGRKGGQLVSQNRQHMAEIGRRGGQVRGLRVQQARALGSHHGSGLEERGEHPPMQARDMQARG